MAEGCPRPRRRRALKVPKRRAERAAAVKKHDPKLHEEVKGGSVKLSEATKKIAEEKKTATKKKAPAPKSATSRPPSPAPAPVGEQATAPNMRNVCAKFLAAVGEFAKWAEEIEQRTDEVSAADRTPVFQATEDVARANVALRKALRQMRPKN